MSNRATFADRPRSTRLVVLSAALFVFAILLQYAVAATPALAAGDCNSFAIFTTDAGGNTNNQNHYDSKPEVYLNGGPTSAGGGLEAGTTIYYQVQEPDGTPLNEIRSTTVQADQTFRVQLFPFDTTSNSGGEYKVVASTLPDLESGACTKSDNFKVDGPGSLKIVKAVDGGEVEGDFDIHVDCGGSGTFDRTISFPDPGFVTIAGIDNLAECTVTETGMPDPPANFHWGDPTIGGSPATIHTDETVTVTVTNHLVRDKGSLEIKKVVTGGSATGDFTFHIDCGEDFSDDVTITLPGSGSVTVNDIPAGAECTVTETDVPSAPSGFEWGAATIDGSPATIVAENTVTVTVTNPLEQLPPPNEPDLTIQKSNNSPGVTGVAEGATVHFTLNYTLTNGPVDHGVITDVLPAGLTYVANTATNSDEFTFISYTAATRTLRWEATQVTKNGKLEYDATVDTGAAGKVQPLVNTATIDSDQTDPHSSTSNVFVAPPPQAETSVPHTAPPTDTSIGSTDSGASGTSMLLILLALAGFALAVLFVAPTPASVRKRMR